jgi:type II secretory pathway component PulJ
MQARRTRRNERGVTLIEMMVAITLLMIVGPIIASVMVSSLRAGAATEEQSRVMDELRQQMYAVSRELRSASCISVPSVANTPGNTLAFTTESQTGSVATATDLQYQVTAAPSGGYQLVRTQYDANGVVTGTRIVGPGLVSPSTTFELRSTPRKSVIVKLQLQMSATRPIQELTTTIAGRNAWLTC